MTRPRVVSLRDKTVQARITDGDRTLIRVDRKTKWGNPFPMANEKERDKVIQQHATWIVTQHRLVAALHELEGRDLACWCAPKPCHADTLLALANQDLPDNEPETIN
jgi:hypothetical protein